jgi:hypothetical protein
MVAVRVISLDTELVENPMQFPAYAGRWVEVGYYGPPRNLPTSLYMLERGHMGDRVVVNMVARRRDLPAFGSWVHLILLARESSAHHWWGGVSAGGTWLATINFRVTHPGEGYGLPGAGRSRTYVGARIETTESPPHPSHLYDVLIPPAEIAHPRYTQQIWTSDAWSWWPGSQEVPQPGHGPPPPAPTFRWLSPYWSACVQGNSGSTCS